MSDETKVDANGGDLWVTPSGEGVTLEAHEQDGPMRGFVTLVLTPSQAVKVSRALVAAAAEALGVKA